MACRVGAFNSSKELEHSTVCLTGPVGVGKSSFIVTLASCLTGSLEVVAGVGTGTESFTREAYDHVLEYKGKACAWKIRDTPGDLFDVRLSVRVTITTRLSRLSRRNCKFFPQVTNS
jgi:putative ribosome biogenesis GTPase RsgA